MNFIMELYIVVENNPYLMVCNGDGNKIFELMQGIIKEGIIDGSIDSKLDPNI